MTTQQPIKLGAKARMIGKHQKPIAMGFFFVALIGLQVKKEKTMEQQKLEENGLRRFYAENILRNRFGMKSDLSDVLSSFIIDFYDKFFNDFDYEKVKHIRNAQSNMCAFSATPDEIYRVTFILGLMDKDTLAYHFSKEQAVRKVVDTIGDCTINDCIGYYKGRQMQSLQITKLFRDEIPKNYVHNKAKELKNIFNQESVITDVFRSCQIDFNEYNEEYEKEINAIMFEYNTDWNGAVMIYNSGLY